MSFFLTVVSLIFSYYIFLITITVGLIFLSEIENLFNDLNQFLSYRKCYFKTTNSENFMIVDV